MRSLRNKTSRRCAPPPDRFATKYVVADNGCWEWNAARNDKGYGHFKMDGAVRQAHRVSWELHFGPIEGGMHVLHKCDNPSCVNPDHLFLGTNADNAADCKAKGRHARPAGESNPRARLTAQQVRDIRASKETLAAQAARYGVAASTVWAARSGQNWHQHGNSAAS